MKKRLKVFSFIILPMVILCLFILSLIGYFEWFVKKQNAYITINDNHADGYIDYRIDSWWTNHGVLKHGIQGFITVRSSSGKFVTYWIGDPEYNSPNIGRCNAWVAPSTPVITYKISIDESQCSNPLADDDSGSAPNRMIHVIATGKRYVSFINDKGLKIDAKW